MAKDTFIYDMHTHIFPEKIAEKAASSIGSFYDIPMDDCGTAKNLLNSGKVIGVKKYLVCSTATTPRQVESINNFIASEQEAHPEFIAYGSLHPDFDKIEEEVDRIISLGLKGIKLHPDFQNFEIDDPKADAIYRATEGRLPILFHMGDYRFDRTKPFRLLNVMKKFPKLTCIGAHLGGYSSWEEVINLPGYLSNPQMYIDTCSALAFLPPEEAVKIIKKHGVDRVFWGTDFPMWTHAAEFDRFMALKLTDDERDKILWKNAADFIGDKI